MDYTNEMSIKIIKSNKRGNKKGVGHEAGRGWEGGQWILEELGGRNGVNRVKIHCIYE